MKKLLLFVLTFSMVISMALPFSFSVAAEGEDVIEIDTAEELLAIGTDETTLAGNYKLTADIVTATGIKGSFKGTFDGNGHKVTGLTTSLFEIVIGGTVKNLTVSANIVGYSTHGTDNNGDIKSATQVGILTNKTEYAAVLENITTLGSITWNAQNPDNSTKYTTTVGGLVGEVWAKLNYTATITNCVNKADITVSNTTKWGSFGGIVGFCSGHGTLNITKCVNEGTLTKDAGDTSPGGIIGRFNEKVSGTTYVTGNIVECANLGDIYVINGAKVETAAGIVGNITTGTISKCYNVGTIDPDKTNKSAGFIGYANAQNKSLVVEYCYNLSPNILTAEFWVGIKNTTNIIFRGCYFITEDGRTASAGNWNAVWESSDTSDPCKSVAKVQDLYGMLSDNGYVMDPNVAYPILPFQLNNLTLEHTDTDGSSFFYQQGTTDTSKFRIIGLIDTDVAKTASKIEVTFTNAEGDTKTFVLGDDEKVYAYSSIDATFNGTTVTYVACDGAVILGWVFSGVPAGYVPSAAVIVE